MKRFPSLPLILALPLLAFGLSASAQYPGWQQEMDCTMDITMDKAAVAAGSPGA